VVLDVDVENRRLSLGHKQLEENPWDIFETVFTVGSDHQGTIVSANDKGAVVQLPYGVEAFCPNKHLMKAEGGNAKVEETLDFKVLEFNKDSKKIIVSHRNTVEAIAIEEKESRTGGKKEGASKGTDETKKAVKKVKDNQEKTTFGDVAGLADLKSALEDKEQGSKD
jgi:small subunit ribosomal protein S1